LIRVVSREEVLEIDAFIKPPSVYLDHWALRLFSSRDDLRKRFYELMEDKDSTLLFSSVNVWEVAKNTGESAEQIRSFLKIIGDRWFPLEFNPFTVIEKEECFKTPAFLGESFLRSYYPHIHGGPLHLADVITLTRENNFNEVIAVRIEEITVEVTRTIDEQREWRKNNPSLKSLPIRPFDARFPTRFIFAGLMDFITKESYQFTINHVKDLLHATVALAYGDMVLLDSHWANLGKRLQLPSTLIFKQDEVELFLQQWKEWPSN